MALRPSFAPADVLTASNMNIIANSLIAVAAQTGTAYTIGTADVGKLVTLSNVAAQAITIPANSSVAFAIGDQVNFMNLSTGTATFSAGGTAVIRSAGSKLKLADQYAVCTVLKIDTDAWVMLGNVKA